VGTGCTEGKGRLCRGLDFLFYRNLAGGDYPCYFESMYTDLVCINSAYTAHRDGE